MIRGELGYLPLARTDGLLEEQVGDETVILDTASGQAHCLSPRAAAVFAHCDGSNSIDELAELAGSQLDESLDSDTVKDALAQLEELALLESPPEGFSRRAFVGKTAVATAAVTAAPMITSVLTPAYAQGTPPPDQKCPGTKCAPDGNQHWCNCINDCPCPEDDPNTAPDESVNPPCAPANNTTCHQAQGVADNANTGDPRTSDPQPPELDSCECLKCPGGEKPEDYKPPPDTPQGDFSGQPLLAAAFCKPLYGDYDVAAPEREQCGNSADCTGGNCVNTPGLGGHYGCNDAQDYIYGVCFRKERFDCTTPPCGIGDTSEPCPDF